MSLTHKIREGLWTGTVASVLENLLKIPRMMIVSRALGPEYYGILGLLTVFREIVGTFIQFGTGDAVIKFLAEAKSKNDTKQISSIMVAAEVIRFATISAIVLISIFFSPMILKYVQTYPVFNNVNPGSMKIIYWLVVSGVIVQAVEGPLGNALQGFQAWRSLLVVRIISALASTMFPIAAALMGYKIIGIVFSQQLAFAVTALAIGYFYIKRVKPLLESCTFHECLGNLKKVLGFGLPLIINQFTYLGYTYIDQLMLAGMGAAASDLSFFDIARNTSSMLVFIPTLMRNVMFPAVSEYFAQRNRQRLEALFRFMVKHLTWFLLPMCVWMAFLSPAIIEIISGESYLKATPALSCLAALMSLRSIEIALFTCLVGAFSRTRAQLCIGICGCFANLVLNYFLIPQFSFMGAVYATIFTRVATLFLGLFFLGRHMNIRIPLYSISVCLGLSLATGAALMAGYRALGLPGLAISPASVFFYLYAIVKLRIFDEQDITYVNRLLGPLGKRAAFAFEFLERNVSPVKQKDML